MNSSASIDMSSMSLKDEGKSVPNHGSFGIVRQVTFIQGAGRKGGDSSIPTVSTSEGGAIPRVTEPALRGWNKGFHSSIAPSYPAPSTRNILSLCPEMHSSGAPPCTEDAAAHAFSSLSLDKDREHTYDATQGLGQGPPSSYPPPLNASSPNSSLGLPYLASPISGVVTGVPYTPPSPSYTNTPPSPSYTNTPSPYRSLSAPEPGSYPPSAPYFGSYPAAAPFALNLPENLDVSSAGKEKAEDSSDPPQYYGRPPPSNTESYPSAYPPEFNDSKTGQGFPSFSPYGATPPVPYRQPEGYEDQGKEKTRNEFDSPTSKYESSPSIPRSDPPQSGYPPSGSYPPVSGQHDLSAFPGGYPLQQTGEQNTPTEGFPAQNVMPGELTTESTVSSSSGADGEKGFKHGHQYGYGGYPQPGYAQAGYPQPGYGQPMYPQPGYGAYPSHGFAPNYPPAYPGHGYAPEGYPSHGHGVPGYPQPYGYGGHGLSHHAPAPYGGYGAPHYGGHGHYKHHKGGHKGYKHKKMKKGHYLHYQQPYGYGGHHGGPYGGHHGGHHGKHGHGKHKH